MARLSDEIQKVARDKMSRAAKRLNGASLLPPSRGRTSPRASSTTTSTAWSRRSSTSRMLSRLGAFVYPGTMSSRRRPLLTASA
jgi:hypothetical protein